MRRIARMLRRDDGLFCLRRCLAERAHTFVESLKLVLPGFHLALGQRDFDGEAARRELGMSLGTPALPRQRAHLALDLADQVVEALQVARRLLEPR
jgi:hypothetical protein